MAGLSEGALLLSQTQLRDRDVLCSSTKNPSQHHETQTSPSQLEPCQPRLLLDSYKVCRNGILSQRHGFMASDVEELEGGCRPMI